MSKRRGPNKDNLEETHRAFIEIARVEFAEFGYSQASTSRIVEGSGMARGSLYYHFGDKQGLFRAVYEDVMMQSIDVVSERMDVCDSPWDAFMAGTDAFIDLCMDTEFRKIVLIECQGALSYKERFEIQERTFLAKMREVLPSLIKEGYFPGHTIATLAIFISGILGEIGRTFDFSENLERDRKIFGRAFEHSMKNMVARQADSSVK